MNNEPLIFCAIDTADFDYAMHLAKQVGTVTGGLKLGMGFINSFGPQGIEAICKACPEAKLFIDLKFHDIPNTVAAAIFTICEHFSPAYINVHASGGAEMMHAAKAACKTETKILAVTILTSLNHNELYKIGYKGETVLDSVKRLAILAQDSGLDGVVCSAYEIEMLRKQCDSNFILMVPGIRPEGTNAEDQKRVMTPKQAVQKGASHLVIGRPITKTDDPAEAAQNILESISS